MRSDLHSIVLVHEAAFPGFFLTSLGHSFLYQLYRGFALAEHGICFVADAASDPDAPKIVGFAAGSAKPALFFRNLLVHRGLYFGIAAIPGLIRRPATVLPKLLNAVRYRGEQVHAAPEGALLSSIGVHPDVGRKGLGRMLIDAFCTEAARQNAALAYLITDRDRNDAVNQWYLRTGFTLAATQPRGDGRVMNTYVRAVAYPHLRKEIHK